MKRAQTRRQATHVLIARKTLPTRFLALLLAGAGLLWSGAASAIPSSYQFRGIGDYLLVPESGFATDPFTEKFTERQLSVASALNNNGFLIGFWMGNDDSFNTYSLQFGTNPLGVVRFTDNFIGLSGSDVPCINLFGILLCSNPEFPYGTRIVPNEDPTQLPTVVSAFLNTMPGSVAVPGSLPYMRYPGNFVDENSRGILASTQLSPTAQYGVIVRGETVINLPDIPWVVAINDLIEPLVIAYNGNDGGCFVYGEGCLPEPTPCEEDPNPGNAGGDSGREASGNAWGHNKCKDGIVDGNNGGGGTGGSGSGGSGGGGTGTPANGAILLHLKADNSVVRYGFPSTTPLGTETGTVTHLFPLAINSTQVVLRGDVTLGSTVFEKRLLSCSFNTVPDMDGVIVYDTDADQVIDCLGGLQLIGGLQHNIRVGTVLGFTLNDDQLLAGNFGYNASGVGLPMLTNLADVVPVAEPAGNLAAGTDGWEINTITDMNRAGMMTGYGYKDCGRDPEAFYFAPQSTPPEAGVRFQRGDFEFPAYLAPGTTLQIRPTLTGGSGAYELRVHVRKPGDEAWQLLTDWSTDAGSWSPGAYQGEVCFKIEARDPSATAAAAQQTVVRYSVGVSPRNTAPDDDTGTGLLTPTQGDFEVGDLLAGGLGFASLLMLGLAGLRRRR